MQRNYILCITLLTVFTFTATTENIQHLIQDALRILHELEQQENLYIPRVLNKELYNLLQDASNDELITFMQEAEQLRNKQLVNSTAAVIVDRYDLAQAPEQTQRYIKEQVSIDSYPFIDKYINFSKRNNNTRACSGTQRSIQDYVNAYGVPIISLGSTSILNFDSQNINSLYGLQNISNSSVGVILLSNNCIEGVAADPQFPSTPFTGLPNTNSIFLQNNSIGTLPSNFLNGLSFLSDLILANNQLSSFPSGFFTGKNLYWLDVSNNNFSSTSSIVISSMTNLQIISLGGNPLGSIPGTYFQNNTALTNIYVNNTGLAVWPTNLLSYAPGLQYLNAANNSLITFLPASIASGSYVILTGNLIPTLTQVIIRSSYPNVNFVF